MAMTRKKDELLSHDVDGIHEFDNALPRWWLYGFYFTIGFAVVYYVNYHVLAKPLFGMPTLVAEYREDVEHARHAPGGMADASGRPVVALSDAASLAKGQAIFEGPDNTCFACHRQDLGGLVGPNLTDEYWLHGCAPADLVRNVKTGFPQKGMLPFGTGKTLTDEQVLQVVSYVLSRKGSHPANPKPSDPDRDKACG
jgi:cytochrome c oxidase cbb3-type subunit 3